MVVDGGGGGGRRASVFLFFSIYRFEGERGRGPEIFLPFAPLFAFRSVVLFRFPLFGGRVRWGDWLLASVFVLAWLGCGLNSLAGALSRWDHGHGEVNAPRTRRENERSIYGWR